MSVFRNLSVSAKVYLVVVLLSVVAAAVGGLGVMAMTVYSAKVEEIRNADERALLSERINGLTLAVVMDSRGIYMATDVAEAQKYGKPLLGNLKTMERLLAEWAALVPPSERARFAAAQDRAGEFARFRSDLVRIGSEQGAAAARAVGDNETNRANRQALNKELEVLADETSRLSQRLHKELEESGAHWLSLLIGIGLGGVTAGIVLAVFMARALIAKPIVCITGVMNALAAGNTAVEVPALENRDEIGAMARAVARFREQSIENEGLRAEQERMRAAAEAQRLAALEGMAATVEQESRTAVNAVASRTAAMSGDAERMTAAAQRVGHNAQEVAAAAQQALANVETVAAAAEQLTTSIQEIGRQVAQASGVTRLSVDSSQVTQQTIQSLSEAVGRIGDVADLIADIASQTNLLALNATIEAARAGEAGKGFAVVAGEVKALATQTARATEEIASQIAQVREVTGAAVSSVSEIGGHIMQIDGIANSIAVAVEEQAAATLEISRNVAETAHAARQVSARIEEVSVDARTTGSVADSVRATAAGVAESIEDLQHVLVRVVRTSTKDADRRRRPRYRVDRAAQVSVDGNRQPVTVRNLSEGGALIDGGAALAEGARGTLSLDGFAQPLAFRTLADGHEGLHVRFELDARAQEAFGAFFRTLVQGRTPLAA
ncbi:methyl-accepting chemotaxis protein [Azospirillum sp. sgz301742]